jgi:hypothetical protein
VYSEFPKFQVNDYNCCSISHFPDFISGHQTARLQLTYTPLLHSLLVEAASVVYNKTTRHRAICVCSNNNYISNMAEKKWATEMETRVCVISLTPWRGWPAGRVCSPSLRTGCWNRSNRFLIKILGMHLNFKTQRFYYVPPGLTLILLMWRKRWANSNPIYIQQDATLHSLFISGNCSTYFRW